MIDSGNGLTSWLKVFLQKQAYHVWAHCPVNSLTQLAESKVNKFVANFIGMANFIPCEIVQRSENAVRVKLLDGSNRHFLNVPLPEDRSYGENVVVVLRPEDIDVLPSDGGESPKGIMERLIYIGDRNDCVVRFGDVSLRVLTQPKYSFKVGQEVSLVFTNPILLDA